MKIEIKTLFELAEVGTPDAIERIAEEAMKHDSNELVHEDGRILVMDTEATESYFENWFSKNQQDGVESAKTTMDEILKRHG